MNHQSAHFPTGWDLSWFRTDDDYYFRIATWADQVNPGWGRINGFIPRLLGTRPQFALTLLGIFMLALPFLAGGRISRSRVRFIPVLVVSSILLLFPTFLFGTMYTFQRFTYLFVPLYLIMIDTPVSADRVQRSLRLLAPVIALVWIGYMSVHAVQFNKDMEGFDDVVAKMEPGKRALSLVFQRDDSHSIAPVFLHFPSWYAALKSGITDPSFAQLPAVAGYLQTGTCAQGETLWFRMEPAMVRLAKIRWRSVRLLRGPRAGRYGCLLFKTLLHGCIGSPIRSVVALPERPAVPSNP